MSQHEYNMLPTQNNRMRTNQDTWVTVMAVRHPILGARPGAWLISCTERVGFEPTEGFPSNDFESFAFDHSATSPDPWASEHLTERSARRSTHWPATPAAGERWRGQAH